MSADFSTYLAETPVGDTYGRQVGHVISPTGQQIALWQGNDADDLNAVLVKRVWSLYLCDGEG